MTAREHVSLLTYPAIRRPADPARRLEQDLCDDRLAPGLRRLAARRCCRMPSGWRSTAIPASMPPPNMPASRRLTGPREPMPQMVDAFAERRSSIVPALNALPGVTAPCRAGPSTLFPISAAPAAIRRTLQSRLLDEAGVATMAGTSFGALGEGYLRLSYAASLPMLSEAVAPDRRVLGQSARVPLGAASVGWTPG